MSLRVTEDPGSSCSPADDVIDVGSNFIRTAEIRNLKNSNKTASAASTSASQDRHKKRKKKAPTNTTNGTAFNVEASSSVPVQDFSPARVPPKTNVNPSWFPACDDVAGKNSGGLSFKMIEKFKRMGVNSLFPQVDDLSSVQLEVLAAKVNPEELSTNVRNHFFRSKQDLPKAPSCEDDSGELTDLSDLEESESSIDSMQCKWTEEKVQLGAEDASIAELIESRTILLDQMLTAYNDLRFEFEDKQFEDSCARNRGLVRGVERSILNLKNFSLSSDLKGVRCDVKDRLQYYSNMNSCDNGIGAYMHQISHIPKAMVRSDNNPSCFWKSSNVVKEHLRNNDSRVEEKKVKEKRGRGAKDFDVNLPYEEQEHVYGSSSKKKQGRQTNESERKVAKAIRSAKGATRGRLSGVNEFNHSVNELYVLHSPLDTGYKDVALPIWGPLRNRRRHLDPCENCDKDGYDDIPLNHHLAEHQERRAYLMKNKKLGEGQGKPSAPLPPMPPFDPDALNNSSPNDYPDSPYRRRKFSQPLLRP